MCRKTTLTVDWVAFKDRFSAALTGYLNSNKPGKDGRARAEYIQSVLDPIDSATDEGKIALVNLLEATGISLVALSISHFSLLYQSSHRLWESIVNSLVGTCKRYDVDPSCAEFIPLQEAIINKQPVFIYKRAGNTASSEFCYPGFHYTPAHSEIEETKDFDSVIHVKAHLFFYDLGFLFAHAIPDTKKILGIENNSTEVKAIQHMIDNAAKAKKQTQASLFGAFLNFFKTKQTKKSETESIELQHRSN